MIVWSVDENFLPILNIQICLTYFLHCLASFSVDPSANCFMLKSVPPADPSLHRPCCTTQQSAVFTFRCFCSPSVLKYGKQNCSACSPYHECSHAYSVILALLVEVLQKRHAIGCNERSSLCLACSVDESLHSDLLVSDVF